MGKIAISVSRKRGTRIASMAVSATTAGTPASATIASAGQRFSGGSQLPSSTGGIAKIVPTSTPPATSRRATAVSSRMVASNNEPASTATRAPVGSRPGGAVPAAPTSCVAPSEPNGEVPAPNANDVAIAAAADARLPQADRAAMRTTTIASATATTSIVTEIAAAPAPAVDIRSTTTIGRAAPAPAVQARIPVVATASSARAGMP
jgi:hypothetical protein